MTEKLPVAKKEGEDKPVFWEVTQLNKDVIDALHSPLLKHDDAETEIHKRNISLSNVTTVMLLQAWQLPLTVSGVIQMADATQRHIKNRCDLMKVRYGAPVEDRKNGSFEVLD